LAFQCSPERREIVLTQTLNSRTTARAYVRKARDCVVAPKVDEKQTHRAAHSLTVDYGLQDITNDSVRGVATMPGFCADKPGNATRQWHYHDCQAQLGVILAGSVELAFANETYLRAQKGAVSLIPGHVMHDVAYPSADYQVVEFTFPGSFATIPAPAPEGGKPSPARVWGLHQAVRTGCERGLIHYSYPVEAPYNDNLRITLQRRSRVDPFEAGSLRHNDKMRLILVTQGTREVEIEGETIQYSVGDVLVIPAGAECRDMSASEEHEAVCMELLN
jgi:quercetin dioxygenase-like cupin family protein